MEKLFFKNLGLPKILKPQTSMHPNQRIILIPGSNWTRTRTNVHAGQKFESRQSVDT